MDSHRFPELKDPKLNVYTLMRHLGGDAFINKLLKPKRVSVRGNDGFLVLIDCEFGKYSTIKFDIDIYSATIKFFASNDGQLILRKKIENVPQSEMLKVLVEASEAKISKPAMKLLEKRGIDVKQEIFSKYVST